MMFETWPRTLHIQGSMAMAYLEFGYATGPRKVVTSYATTVKPLNFEVWICVIIALVLVLLAFVIIDWRHQGKVSVSRKAMNILAIMVDQQSAVVHKAKVMDKRVMCGFFILAALVLTASYKGNLLASLVSVEREPKIDTTQDVLKSGKTLFYSSVGAVTVALQNSPNRDIQVMMHEQGVSYVRPESPELLTKIKANKAILVQNREASFQLGLISSKEQIYYAAATFTMSRDWPWNEDVLGLAHGLVAGGLVQKIVDDSARRSDAWMREHFDQGHQDEPIVLSLAHMAAPIVLLSAGLAISILSLLAEMMSQAWH